MGDGGKGSAPRPFTVNIDEFHNSFERIFGKRERTPYVYVPPEQQEFEGNVKDSTQGG